jgi:hypothetical protein
MATIVMGFVIADFSVEEPVLITDILAINWAVFFPGILRVSFVSAMFC